MKKLKQKIKDKLGEKKTASLKKALKVGRIVKNIICWTMIALLTLAIIIFVVTKVSGGTPTLFGYSIHRIVSGSMTPELEIGDVILDTRVKEPSEVHVGDIITFQGDRRFENQKVTHRVLVAPYDNGKGNIVLVTKGDANTADDGEINFSDVEAKLVTKVSFLKDIYTFFFSPWGFIVFIFLLLLIFFDEILNIVRLTAASAAQERSESFEEIVERVKKEQLESAKEQLPSQDEGQPEVMQQADDPNLPPECKEINESVVQPTKAEQEKRRKDNETKAKMEKDDKTAVRKNKTNGGRKLGADSKKKSSPHNQSNHPTNNKSKKKKRKKRR
nr:signal peptidase I [uncultured Ruminococcus sp.]